MIFLRAHGERNQREEREEGPPLRDPGGEDPGREDEEVRLPRRPRPEGETAARAGPAGGHGGGAQRAGPKGEPRRHGCWGLSAVSKRKGVWDALHASKPRRGTQHPSRPSRTWRKPETPEAAKTRPRGGGATTQKHVPALAARS